MSGHKRGILSLAIETSMKKISSVILCLSIFLLGACMQFALRLSPSLFPNFTSSIFEECDSELAKTAIPANLKLMEGLLKNDPENRQILATLSMGFTGYSMLFVEDVDPERASMLYRRARDYGIKALGNKGSGLMRAQKRTQEFLASLKEIGKGDLEALLWTAVSWNAWIYLNLDKPEAIAQVSASQACLERVMEIDPNYFQGLPQILMGVSLSARSPMFGGDVEKAKVYFNTALQLTQRKFLLGQYLFAKYYAVRVQDKKLFIGLLREVVSADPRELMDVCLINAVTQQKAKRLGEMADEFFF
jgi:tetratricopeptide (TPR) repeat protein